MFMLATFWETLLPSSGRVMVGQQIICTNVGPAWKHCFHVVGCFFLNSDWDDVFTSDPPLSFNSGHQMCGSLYDISLM